MLLVSDHVFHETVTKSSLVLDALAALYSYGRWVQSSRFADCMFGSNADFQCRSGLSAVRMSLAVFLVSSFIISRRLVYLPNLV